MIRKYLSLIIILCQTCCSPPGGQSVCYYFDPVRGTDTGPGTSPATAFKSLAKIGEIDLAPGDSILLKSGGVFTEQLFLSCRGDHHGNIVIGKYGGDALPHIKGDGSKLAAVYVYNSEYLVIRDLEISNRGILPVHNLNGLLVELKGFGKAREIIIENLFIHDVYGSLVKEEGSGNAMMIRNYDDKDTVSASSHFDGLRIQNCHIKDCQRNGIIMWGNWIRSKWDPNLNVIISHNLIEGVPGDGIMASAAHRPVIEYNVMRGSPPTLPPTEACDGIWPWSCDSAIIQFNTVSDHKSHVDAYGFDSDWNSTDSLFQYNLSYNNDGGFLLVCNPGGWPASWSIGNHGTIARFNVSINDGIRDYLQQGKSEYFSPVVHVTGPVSHTIIEKNIFCIMPKKNRETDRTLLSFTDWYGYPDSTFFRDNYFCLAETHRAVVPGQAKNTFIAGNIYTGRLRKETPGFVSYDDNLNLGLWYDKNDKRWDMLVEFLRDKTVPVNGTEIPVLQIIGFTQ